MQSVTPTLEAIEADYQMKDGMLVLNMRAQLVGYALRRWAVDCTPSQVLDPRSHHLYLNNPQTLYGVESSALASGYSVNMIQALGPDTWAPVRNFF